MGNICFKGAEEKKATAFAETNSDVTDRNQSIISSNPQLQHQPDTANATGLLPQQALAASESPALTAVSPAEQKAADERLKAEQEEQARLDVIVQATGRGMVPVRSQRGSTGYYDQGFAAALAQHLEQTTQFSQQVAAPLPPAAANVYARLAQPEWEGIALGNKDGENPVTYMDHIAEQCLDAVIPKKERLFANVDPIMENLL